MITTGRPRPYVGISGIGLSEEHAYIREMWNETSLAEAGRLILLGIKGCSNQTEDKPDRHGDIWYPCGDAVSQTLLPPPADSGELPTIQAYFGEEAENYSSDRLQQATERMLGRISSAQAIQYDMFPWYEADAQKYLRQLHSDRPDLQMLIQLNKGVLDVSTPRELTEKLARQADVWSYALFDTSHGEGVEISVDHIAPFLEAVYSHPDLDHLNFAVAGGLSADTLPLIADLLRRYPELSFDSESRLHYQNGEQGGRLIPEAVRGYLHAADANISKPPTQ
jgi:hypothetical protein